MMDEYNGISSNLESISLERNGIVVELQEKMSLFAATQTEKESLSLQVREIQEEKTIIEKQLGTACEDQDKLSEVIKNLKTSFAEAVTEKETYEVSFTDAKQQIQMHNDHIASLESERKSLSNRAEELDQQLTARDSQLKSLKEEAPSQANALKDLMSELTSLNENALCLQSKLSNGDASLKELSYSKEELLQKYMHLIKNQDAIVSEKSCLVVEISEKSSLIADIKSEKMKCCHQ